MKLTLSLAFGIMCHMDTIEAFIIVKTPGISFVPLVDILLRTSELYADAREEDHE